MPFTQQLIRYGGARLSSRMTRALPVLGAAVALLTLGATMRRKGMVRGALDTGLNAMPFLGAAKAVLEVVRGRDFFPDRL
jgi:hypothetical protein